MTTRHPSGHRVNLAFLARSSPRIRGLVLALLALAVSALVIVNSGGQSWARPVAWAFGGALGLNAGAQADQAQALIAAQVAPKAQLDPVLVQSARAKAIAALRRDTLQPRAWRALAMAEPNGPNGGSDRSFAFLKMAAYVSKRDAATSALLFQEYVRRRDLPEAFRQFNLAMRRSPEARQAMLPPILPGLGDREFRRYMISALGNQAPWGADLLKAMALSPPTDETVTQFVAELPASVIARQRNALQTLAASLVQAGRLKSAQTLSRRLLPLDTNVMDGDFESSERAPPLTWAVQATDSYDAAQGQYGGAINGKQALYVRTSLPDPVEVARQIVFLKPGRYRLSALAGARDDAPPSLSVGIACVGKSNSVGPVLTELFFPSLSQRASRGEVKFAVPASECAGQWLLITVGQGSRDHEASGWLDDVAIDPIP